MATEPLSQRPYLLRALHEWMSDSGLTPHILVDASGPGVEVPPQHIENGKIVLNISYSATRNLELGNDQISFDTRFAGVTHDIFVPVPSVLGIYARESGEGLIFSDQQGLEDEVSGSAQDTQSETEPSAATDEKSGSSHPHLRVIK